jgi:hypothetical protein
MKKTILISISTILLLSSGCGFIGGQDVAVPKMNVNKVTTIDQKNANDGLNNAISKYLEERLSIRAINGKIFEAHELYGTEEKDGKITAYIWSRMQEYDYKDGKLIEGAGTSMPLVVALEKKDNAYNAVDFSAPADGSGYFDSIKKLFPEKYIDKILARSNAEDLERIVMQKAENHFSVTNKGEGTKNDSGTESKDGVAIKAEGNFEGQIDNNSIEISIKQASREKATMAFRFSDSGKESFDKLGLKRGDQVKVDYVINGYDQKVIVNIEKVK